MLDRNRCALVLVDYQARLMPALADGASVVDAGLFLARVAGALGVKVLATEQNPQSLGPNVDELRALSDHTLPKMHFDATADGLLDLLRSVDPGVKQVVVAGCETHVCLMQTALGLMAAGLATTVVPEACGSRRASDKALALQRLAASGATLASAEMVAFEWLRSASDPQFKTVLSLIKSRPV
jgi:nicotinamidase-related amidase